MDEPLGALDKKLREQMQIEIKRVHRERRMSVLYVTHDQEEALTMSDRIAVFNKGKVEQIGTPFELYERPATRFVAGFIGETNFLPGRALAVDDAICDIEVMGVRLKATARGAITPGTEIVVAVRPERVRVSSDANGATGFAGKLVDIIYLGNARKYVVRLPGGRECVALQQANSADTSGLHPGGQAMLCFETEHVTAFPA